MGKYWKTYLSKMLLTFGKFSSSGVVHTKQRHDAIDDQEFENARFLVEQSRDMIHHFDLLVRSVSS